MSYLALVVVISLLIVLREYWNTKLRIKKSIAFRIQLHKEKASKVQSTRRKISIAKKAISGAEVELSARERRIIQLMTSNNNFSTKIDSLHNQLNSVVNEHEMVRQQLNQIQQLNSEEDYKAHGQTDAKNAENLKIELFILSNSFNKLSEKLVKYSNNNQKIIKSINETTIKNFEINKEIEDNLFNTLKEIQLENHRLETLHRELIENLKRNKLKIIALINNLKLFKENNLTEFINLKIKELTFLAEKIAIEKLRISQTLLTNFEKNKKVDISLTIAKYMPEAASNISNLQSSLKRSLDQKHFEIESIEHEIRQAKKKLLMP